MSHFLFFVRGGGFYPSSKIAYDDNLFDNNGVGIQDSRDIADVAEIIVLLKTDWRRFGGQARRLVDL